MISIIITSYKEEKTIGKSIEQILKNKMGDYEILVVAPDEKTLLVAKSYRNNNKNIRLIKDPGKGKPAALNIAINQAKGEILILTDGDVFIGEQTLLGLIKPFENSRIGAVSGNPISLNSRKEKMGFWAYLLTNIANERRKRAISLKRRFFCSGYLFAIRKSLFPSLSEDLLSEDGFISHNIYKKGFIIGYSEASKVYIKYPITFKDWIIQKKRSAGGYNQIKKMINVEIRSFKKESLGGFSMLKYVSNPREFIWLVELAIARIYLWLVIYREINLKKKTGQEMWQRVESTK
jgi:cellulose synthase/poly-beta-1,6-N-acetylglucosamine synthase-like glycosyltransferase